MSVYSPNKFVHFPEHVNSLRAGRVIAPVHVRVKPINHCNHACWYCAYRADGLSLGEDMDLRSRIPADKMREIVADFINMGVKAVTFSGGGEPLLYKTLPEHVRDLAQAGVRVAALTNGSNLKGKMADAFANWGTWVRVSLDAWDGPSYAKSRSIGSDAFATLIDNMRAFAARGSRCVLGVSFIVDRSNCSHISEVCRLLKDVGVSHVKLSAAVVSNEADANNEYHREIAGTVLTEIDAARILDSDDFHIVNHYHEMNGRFDKSYSSCPSLQFLTVIGADCGVYTCQDKAYSKSGLLGSVADRRFSDFWFSEELKERMHSLNPGQECLHHCMSHNKNLMMSEMLSLDNDHIPFV